MKRIVFLLGIIIPSLLNAQQNGLKIAKLHYQGGGDWYANPTSLPNLIKFIKANTNIQLDQEEYIVEPGGTEIFQYPYIYMTGHGTVTFDEQEAKNIRNYLISGGFLHADDNYGMDESFRAAMAKVFPELQFVELDFEHPIFSVQYKFEKGLPKIHEHDGKSPQALGLFYENRLVCLYTYECDLGDGWEDRSVHNDSEALREKAFQVGTNIVIYALTN